MAMPLHAIAENVNNANSESLSPGHSATPSSSATSKQKNSADQTQPMPVETEATPKAIGSIVIEYGINKLQGQPQQMSPDFFWGSRVLKGALYYDYEIPLGTWPLTLSPGLGVSSETYQFGAHENKYYTLVQNTDSRTTLEDAQQIVQGNKGVLYSQLDCHYVDFMLELRVGEPRTVPIHAEHPFAAIGARMSARFRSSTSFNYEGKNGPERRITTVAPFGLSRIRYGLYVRLGYGGLGAYYNWMSAPLFNNKKGPNDVIIMSHHICLSLNVFQCNNTSKAKPTPVSV